MEKNREYKGQVLSFGSEGEGVIKLGEYTAFVPFCITGEEVSFKALKVNGGVAYGKLTEVHTLSPHRTTAQCPYFEKCGGCQLQHMDYATQLEFKRRNVQNCLKKLGGIDVEVGETVASAKQYGYRNKLAMPVGTDGDGRTVVGFFAPRSHRIVPVSSCALQSRWSNALITALIKFMDENGLSGYDEIRQKGDIRHIVCREAGGKFVITVVAAHNVELGGFVTILDKLFADYTLWLNINNSRGNAIFGNRWNIVSGSGYYDDEAEGVKYTVGANTFSQVNDDVRKKLYGAVIAACADKDAIAVDLYSGGGLLTAMLAKSCRAAYGVEIVKEAVECADKLKIKNNLDEKMFNCCGAVEELIDDVFEKTAGYRRVIVCDPPRKGMERSVVNAVLKSGAEKVVLISCNPATLARDLGLLCGSLTEVDNRVIKNPAFVSGKAAGQYEILSVTPFDMFPQTKHVETLVVLSRKKPVVPSA